MGKRAKELPPMEEPPPVEEAPVVEETPVVEEELPPGGVDSEALEQCLEKVRTLEADVKKLEALAAWAEEALTPVFKYLRIRPPKRPE